MAKISRRSQRYWAERKARELYENLIPVEEAAEDLRSLYYQASREIEKEAAKIVTKFADLHHLTIEEAEVLLDTVLDPKDMKAITRALRADPTKQELVAQLDAPAYAARINRLAKMQDQVDEVVSKLLTPVGDTFNEVLTEIGQRSYYQSLFGFQERTGIDFPIIPIEEEKLAEILNTRWSGKNYSERLWDNTEKLAESVKRELAVGVLTGKSRHDMSRAIRDEFGSASYETRRLIRTEATYVSGQMDLVSYRQMGVTEYEYIAILDARTSEICRDLDAKRFPVASAQPGVNYPPMHPWCRSSTTPALPKGLDDLLTVTSYDENNNERKETLTEARAAREELAANPPERFEGVVYPGNYSNDQGQYRRYIDRLGNRAPATFEEFIQLKYSQDPQEQIRFDELQTDYRYTGILNRLAEDYEGVQSFGTPAEIPEIYNTAANNLSPAEIEAIQHYSHWEEGIEMTRAYVNYKGAAFTEDSAKYFNTTVAALEKMSLPESTVVYRGTSSGLIDGWQDLPPKLADWKGKEIGTRSITSTSILRDASYAAAADKDVIMVINIPANTPGAGYIESVSYNRMVGKSPEYEVSLQTQSRYTIKEVQMFKGKTIVTVDWKGGTPTWVSPGTN